MSEMKINNWKYCFSNSKIPPQKLIFMLHGCGGNADDILNIVPLIKKHSGVSFVAVAADGFLKSSESKNGFQWFDIENNYSQKIFETDYSSLSNNEKKQFDSMLNGDTGLKKASCELNEFLDFCQNKFSINNDNTMIMGYSQGAMAALNMGFSRNKNKSVGEIVSISGCVLPPDENLESIKPIKSRITLIHGTADTVIGIKSALATQQACQRKGVCVRLIRQNGLSHGRGIDAGIFWNKAAFEIAKIMNKKTNFKEFTRLVKDGICR